MTHKLKKNKVAGTNEVLLSMLSDNIGSATDELKTNASDYIATNYGIDLSGIDVSVVENTESHVHIVLPYYMGLESASAKAIQDADIHDVFGGEAFAAVLIGIMVGLYVTSAVVGIVGLGYGANEAAEAAEVNK